MSAASNLSKLLQAMHDKIKDLDKRVVNLEKSQPPTKVFRIHVPVKDEQAENPIILNDDSDDDDLPSTLPYLPGASRAHSDNAPGSPSNHPGPSTIAGSAPQQKKARFALDNIPQSCPAVLPVTTTVSATTTSSTTVACPYGLSRTAKRFRAYGKHIACYEVLLNKREWNTMISGRLIMKIYGGDYRVPRPRIDRERASKTGCGHILYMKGFHQPFLPTIPGAAGLYLSASPRQDDWPMFEKVFVNAFADQRDPDKLLYVGQYDLQECDRRLAKADFAALPGDTQDHWARHVHDNHAEWAKEIRYRVQAAMPGTSTSKKEPSQGMIKAAYREGKEHLYVFEMHPVGYEAEFQLRLIKAQEEENAGGEDGEDTVITGAKRHVEQRGEDADVPSSSGKGHGTKRFKPSLIAYSLSK
ncbi:hypothetical protein BV25DRAFT_1920453 [Artomyces pyxidatus]|uniref:Uncharacterized protein n=1 Tax=Artomyces pyxidatus TaxID=48021 RepID=A0ACB8SLJ1_9AGAM|nr:hypothetical protein BV25DRAFT_1920453 [Artomyces pyxidatus]